jgi:DNA-binding response OmpR family regulator
MIGPTTAHVLAFTRSTAMAPSPFRVLLADADADTRILYELWLTQHGFDVRIAASADAAFATVRHWRPDIVVTELMLPGGGLGLLNRFLTCEQTRHARLIVLTTQNATVLRREAGEAGAHLYLVKPCSARQLVVAIAAECVRTRR